MRSRLRAVRIFMLTYEPTFLVRRRGPALTRRGRDTVLPLARRAHASRDRRSRLDAVCILFSSGSRTDHGLPGLAWACLGLLGPPGQDFEGSPRESNSDKQNLSLFTFCPLSFLWGSPGACLGLLGPAGPAWACLGLPGPAWACLRLPGLFWASWGLLGKIAEASRRLQR